MSREALAGLHEPRVGSGKRNLDLPVASALRLTHLIVKAALGFVN
jgi:hypothetical protein